MHFLNIMIFQEDEVTNLKTNIVMDKSLESGHLVLLVDGPGHVGGDDLLHTEKLHDSDRD